MVVFFFLSCILVFLCWVVCCLCCVTEYLMPACNVLLWTQVIQANQLIFPALRPLISCLSGGRIFFVLRCTHFRLSMLSVSVPSLKKSDHTTNCRCICS